MADDSVWAQISAAFREAMTPEVLIPAALGAAGLVLPRTVRTGRYSNYLLGPRVSALGELTGRVLGEAAERRLAKDLAGLARGQIGDYTQRLGAIPTPIPTPPVLGPSTGAQSEVLREAQAQRETEATESQAETTRQLAGLQPPPLSAFWFADPKRALQTLRQPTAFQAVQTLEPEVQLGEPGQILFHNRTGRLITQLPETPEVQQAKAFQLARLRLGAEHDLVRLALDRRKLAQGERPKLSTAVHEQLGSPPFSLQDPTQASPEQIAQAIEAVEARRLKRFTEQARVLGTIGLARATIGQLNKSEIELGGVERVFDRIKEISDKVNTFGPLGRFAQMTLQAVARQIQYPEPFAALLREFDTLKAEFAVLSRGVSREVGVLTQLDINRAETLFPQSTDTYAVSQANLRQLRTIIDRGRARLSLLRAENLASTEAALRGQILLPGLGGGTQIFGIRED